MTTRRRQFSEREIALALENAGGIMSAAAAMLTQAEQANGGMRHITRQGIKYRVDRNPKLDKICREQVEEILDMAEGTLVKAITSGDVNAAKFMLETVGKARGYTRRAEHSGPGGLPIQATVSGKVEMEPSEAYRRLIEG